MSKTILIADDSSTIRKLITLTLKALGHQVIAASDGMEALEFLGTSEIDLIVTDLNMPNIDGYELIKTIRQNEAFCTMPIIILSSEDADDDIQKGLKYGANSYLIKPFLPEKIQREVNKFI